MYRCWMKDCGPDDGVDIDAADAQDAAGEACELWNNHGVWAGDPIPWTIEVYVRDSTGACWPRIVPNGWLTTTSARARC